MRKTRKIPIFGKKGLWHCTKGYSLVEIAVVLAILGIVAVAATPSLLANRENYRLKAAARDLYSAMQRCKLEAVKRNAPVVIAVNEAAETYQLFVDDGGAIPANAGNFSRDAGEKLLQNSAPMPDGVTLVSASFSFGTDEAGFLGTGLPMNNRIGNILLRNNRIWYQVALSGAGYVRIQSSLD